VSFDISWDEVAKYVVASPEATKLGAAFINRYLDRFLFGTDEVAPLDQANYTKVFNQYDPLWKLLTLDASRQVRLSNYERLFDAARVNVRRWEKTHPGGPGSQPGGLRDRSSHLPWEIAFYFGVRRSRSDPARR
jgi:hypothetical protein